MLLLEFRKCHLFTQIGNRSVPVQDPEDDQKVHSGSKQLHMRNTKLAYLENDVTVCKCAL